MRYCLNVGFRFLAGAHDIRPREVEHIPDSFAAATLWLDGLVMNGDRTPANPNVLSWHGSHWLIDHGAALHFQHWWSRVTESSPREAFSVETHLFARRRTELRQFDEQFAALVDRDALERALDAVPDELLSALAVESSPRRTRAAYVAFLWKRRTPPRPFL
jgi:hypothetical protein